MPFSRRFSGCFGPCRLIHYLATAGQDFSRCTWTTWPRRSHWSCAKHKDHLQSTNWQVRAFTHTRSCYGTLLVLRDRGRCLYEYLLLSGLPSPASLRPCRTRCSRAIRLSLCRSTRRPRTASRDLTYSEFRRDRSKKNSKQGSSVQMRRLETPSRIDFGPTARQTQLW